MAPAEFEIQMGRLRGAFGIKAFENSIRNGLIWDAVKDLTAPEFERIVTHFISSMRTPPLPIDFKEYIKPTKRYETERTSNDRIECQRCCDTGFVWAKFNSFKVLVRCACDDLPYRWKFLKQDNKIFPGEKKVIGPGVEIIPLDYRDFIPAAGQSRESKIAEWREIKNISEQFWKENPL